MSIWQGLVSRKHAKLSVKPRLEFVWRDTDRPGTGSLTLVNNGLGPAVVTEIRVAINDGSLDMLTDDAIHEIQKSLECKKLTHIVIFENTTLFTGEERRILEGLPCLSEGSKLKTLRARASFTSMYDEPTSVVSVVFKHRSRNDPEV